MNRLRLLLPLFFSITISLPAQQPAIFAFGGNDIGGYPNCGTATVDGGYMMCYQNFGAGSDKDFEALGLVKFQPDGTIQWNRIYTIDGGDDGDRDDRIDGIEPITIARNSDGNYLLAAQFIDHGDDYPVEWGTLLMIFDPHGELISYKNYSSYFRSEINPDEEEPEPSLHEDGIVRTMDMNQEGAILLIESGLQYHCAWVDNFGEIVDAATIVSDDIRHWWFDLPNLMADSAGGFYLTWHGSPTSIGESTINIVHVDRARSISHARIVPEMGSLDIHGGLTLIDGRLLLTGCEMVSSFTFAELGLENETPGFDIDHGGSDLPDPLYMLKYWVVDMATASATETRFITPGSWRAYATMLSTNEVLLTHTEANSTKHPRGYPELDDGGSNDGAMLLSPDGRYISYTPFGMLPEQQRSAVSSSDTMPMRPGGNLDIYGVIPGTGRSVLMYGLDEQWTPYMAQYVLDRPFPCAIEEVCSIDTTTRHLTLERYVVSLKPFVSRTSFAERPFSIAQTDLPMSLTSLCSDLRSLESMANRRSADDGFVMTLTEEVVRIGQPIGLTYSLPAESAGDAVLRVVEAGSGETIVERQLTNGNESTGAETVSTAGWRVGVYVVSLEIVGMKRVGKVVVQP